MTIIENKRNQAIDILRILGILLIILAHTSLCDNSASIAFNIRNFDVIMMVFISGLSFCKAYKPIRTCKEYFLFVWKRFKRLVIPCWVFITLYFIFSLLMKPYFPNNIFTLSNAVLSYSLISGFGYVWIVRVFFILSIMAPFMKLLHEKINNKCIDLLLVFALLFLSSLVSFFTKDNDGLIGKIVNTLILQFVAYGAIYYLSISYFSFPFSLKTILFSVLSIFTIAWCIIFGFNIQANKYPPSTSYLTYGIACSIFFYEALTLVSRKVNLSNRVVVWLSKKSFTIYFCHIFVNFFFSYSSFLEDLWALQYLIVVTSSIILTIICSFLAMISKKLFLKIKKGKTQIINSEQSSN